MLTISYDYERRFCRAGGRHTVEGIGRRRHVSDVSFPFRRSYMAVKTATLRPWSQSDRHRAFHYNTMLVAVCSAVAWTGADV